MKANIRFVFFLFLLTTKVQAQEKISALTTNSKLFTSDFSLKRLVNTFDSSTIYLSDTLALPFLDDFSKKNIQTYTPVYTGLEVSSVLKYSIVNQITGLPLAASSKYSATQGFLYVYDPVLDTLTFTLIPQVTFNYNNLATWPVIYSTINAYPSYSLLDTIGDLDQDTLWTSPTYTQFSARQFFQKVTDAGSYWIDSNAYHNYTFSKDPRTIGMMTFDGLKADGLPYLWNSGEGVADVLTAKPLDLDLLTANDSVYISFLYQRKGFGETPDPNDRFSLEFLNPITQLWEQAWFANGSLDDSWKVGHIRLLNPDYFNSGFQFRFLNEGSLTGILDHWHLDYVHLRKLSGIQDTLFKDFAFVSPIPTLLKTFTAVPWDHYKASPANRMTDVAPIVVRNSSNIPENNQNGILKIAQSNIVLGSNVLPASLLSGGSLNYAPRTTYSNLFDFSTGYAFDPTTLGKTARFDYSAIATAPFPNLAVNDTTFGMQVFEDFYAYDDGSAEAAYGVTGAQAQLAYRFDPYVADSIIGVKMHWAASVTDVQDKLFYLTVWEDNGGLPGNVLYQDNILFPKQPLYGDEKNQFVDYYFDDTLKVKITGPFYIGWKQVDAVRLNIGFDRNTNSLSNVYFSTNNGSSWTQSSIPGGGSLMMRPIISTKSNYDLSIKNEIDKQNATIYPNPFDQEISIETNLEEISFELYDLNGRKVKSGEGKKIETEDLTSGMYILQLSNKNKVIFSTTKIIKK
jgi:Secretion system C-terminal sorting domain